ncbi:type II restriction endonuclease [candidate division KSB3 bacterium]|uniref:Type II restriction endonuclease n=1 Tax=candidate division KSB3 bacterium TaxID=2044937 RepID=A0A9D5K0W9_9BACT|nr:type II restriction endonuclease [candidate division KSB3 bacterium]MBD3327401.1 type II restriction endonuclease [candidate division KSB3 bacterium]
MLIDPYTLRDDLDRLEEIEKSSLRLVVQAIYDYRNLAVEIFKQEQDMVADIGEDITREALDRMGMARIDQRLFGKIDYKRARYLFHPEYAIKQALFVDSKAEKISGQNTATLQTSQFSLLVRQIRAGCEVEVSGTLPPVLTIRDHRYITTTIFVKYNYSEDESGNKTLSTITIAALPNGMLQERYNPTIKDTIWLAGRNAPSRGEAFRVRLSFYKLKEKAVWRVQIVPTPPNEFEWCE